MLCKLAAVEPHFLLHPLDFMGAEDHDDMSFFPTMDEPATRKVKLISECIDIICKDYHAVTMHDHVLRVNKHQELPASTIAVVPEGARADLA